MPIVDNELVSHVPMESFESPNVNVGDYFLDRVKRNIAQFGDAQWIVSILKLISEINQFFPKKFVVTEGNHSKFFSALKPLVHILFVHCLLFDNISTLRII